MSTTWGGVVWTVVFNAALVTSAVTFLILLTLPKAYSPFRPRYITEKAFLQTHRDDEHKRKSGYAFYEDNKDPNGRLTFATSVQVVVLGDIGRSPRMQYHALSIASHGGLVDLIGYTAADLHPDILQNRLITIIPLRPFPPSLQSSNKLLFLLLAPAKVLWQVAHLYHALAYRSPAAKWLLVQTPPSIPTLAVCQCVAFLRNTRLVIDWHNLGYSLLALRLGASHPVVQLAEWYEGYFARGATAHFAVTHAMAAVLKTKWNLTARPLHDRPAEIYQPLSASQRATVLHRLPGTAPYASALLSGSCRLLVSSTSWTADEDFSLLLSALETYSAAAAAAAASAAPLPTILAIITGRGPQRAHYLSRITALTTAGKLPHAIVTTAWLTPSDYALLLGSADLGVSLHTSSSGVDLPMKVVDMFGAGLPVVGWSRFEAWGELVREGENGRGFGSAGELAGLLARLFGGDGVELARLREGARGECARRWEGEWMPVAGGVFQLGP